VLAVMSAMVMGPAGSKYAHHYGSARDGIDSRLAMMGRQGKMAAANKARKSLTSRI
jgi:hypothetical protein